MKRRQKKSSLNLSWKQTVGASLLSSIILLGILNAAFPTHILADSKIISPIADATNLMGVASPSAQLEEVSTSSAVLITPTSTPQNFDVISEIKKIWKKDANVGLAIASCESGLNKNAYHVNSNGTIDFSVFQVNTVHGAILDPEENIEYAHNLYVEQGTNPWKSSEKCWGGKI